MQETKTFKKLLNKPKTNNPTAIYVHHTGGTDAYPLADTSHHTANIIESWHLSKPNWIGIGYHYVIHKNGEVWKGRPEHVHGAHARGVNATSIGICLSGNFDATLPTLEQEASLTNLLLDITKRYGINKEDVKPHRSVANKTCYGNKLGDDWAKNLLNTEKVENHVCELALKDATLNQVIDRLVELKK